MLYNLPLDEILEGEGKWEIVIGVEGEFVPNCDIVVTEGRSQRHGAPSTQQGCTDV